MSKKKDIAIQMLGTGIVDLGKNSKGEPQRSFRFEPDESIPDSVERWQAYGMFSMDHTGNASFFPKKNVRSQARLIKKLRHGRISETLDGGYLLTLKVYKTEPGNIAYQIMKETSEAIEALVEDEVSQGNSEKKG